MGLRIGSELASKVKNFIKLCYHHHVSDLSCIYMHTIKINVCFIHTHINV